MGIRNSLGNTLKMNSKTGKMRLSFASILIASILLSGISAISFIGTVQAASPPATAWTRNYGSYLTDEVAYSVIQTSDGGYVLAGTIYSYPYPPTGYHGLLVKTDSNGNMQWNKTYTGAGAEDYVRSVVQRSDGGYTLAGYTRYSNSLYFYAWLVKTDSAGNVLWNRILNVSAGSTYIYSMVQTSDGGYALAGQIQGFINGIGLLLKTDSSGNYVWVGTAPSGSANSLAQTIDGGFVLAGSALYRFGPTGGFTWSKPIQYPGDPATFYVAQSVVQTSDGGYAYTGAKSSLNVGNDVYLTKTDSNGNTQWTNTYGGSNDDASYSVVQTLDGGYALAGRTKSYGAGSWDFYIVKTDNSGTFQWQKTYGGALNDGAYSMIKTSDGGLALAGYSYSYTNGGGDMWLVKLSALASGYSVTIWAWDELNPNGWISAPITKDGVSTGYSTPHTFDGLKGTHTFTVPSTDASGHPFSDWNTGWTSRTITVDSGGTYTARYRAGYSVTIWAWCSADGWWSLPITKDGISTGFSTPHVFQGLTGTHTFKIPSTDPNGHVFYQWSTGSTSTTLTVTAAGVYTARFEPVPTVKTFSVSPNPFSPNADGVKDNTTIKATFSRTVKWNLQIRNSSGTTLRTWTGSATSLSVLWDGKNSIGYKVPDGTYTVRLTGKDLQGIAIATKSTTATIDTKPPIVTSISVYPTSFKPASGQTTKINYTLSESCYVTIKIYNSTGSLKRTLLNNVLQSSGIHSTVWNGKGSSSLTVSPGTYTIRIYVSDKAGNKAATYPIIKTVTVL